MLQKLFKNNRIQGIILLIFLVAIIWIAEALTVDHTDVSKASRIYLLIFGKINEKNTLSLLFGLLICLLNGIILIRLNIKHFLLEERSFMPAFFYLLILASFPSSISLSPIILGSVFWLITLRIIVDSQEISDDRYAIFKASLVLALGSLFYLKLVFFTPFVILAVSLIRPVTWREVLYPIIAYILLALFSFTYFWFFKDDPGLLIEIAREQLTINQQFSGLETSGWINIGIITIIIIISSFYMISRFQAKKIIIRKFYQVFLSLFIYSLIVLLFTEGFKLEIISILAIPVSYLFSGYFHRKKNHWIREFVLWFWLIFIIYSYLVI